MSIHDIIDEALTLKLQGRYQVIESLYESLSVSNLEVEQAWVEESHRRMETISYEKVFAR